MAVLGGVWWWSDKREKAKEGQPPKDQSPSILTLKDTDIRKAEITHRGGDTTVLAKSDSGTWAITAPKPLAADQSAVYAHRQCKSVEIGESAGRQRPRSC